MPKKVFELSSQGYLQKKKIIYLRQDLVDLEVTNLKYPRNVSVGFH